MSLVVIFGIQPGLLLNLVTTTVNETLEAVQPSSPIEIPASVSIGFLVLILVFIVARIGWVLLRPRRATFTPEGGTAH